MTVTFYIYLFFITVFRQDVLPLEILSDFFIVCVERFCSVGEISKIEAFGVSCNTCVYLLISFCA